MPVINTQSLKSLSRAKAPNRWDIVAFAVLVMVLVGLSWGAKQMAVPYQLGETLHISLDPHMLPYYGLRSVARMLIALVFSLIVTFAFGRMAAQNRLAERLIIPAVDVLQSVPVLGFLSISFWEFLRLFPNSMLGPEMAAIFLVFTSQAWNMLFSFYQSLKGMPREMTEVATLLRLSAWQKFWRLEVPYAMPGLLWNAMLSMSAGWFFVVASEAISIDHQEILLPGIGSYIRVAVDQANQPAIVYAMLAMLVIVIIYDQLLFRPVMHWVSRFRTDQGVDEKSPQSWVVNLYYRTRLMRRLSRQLGKLWAAMINMRLMRRRCAVQSLSDVHVREKTSLVEQMLFWIIVLATSIGAAYFGRQLLISLPVRETWMVIKLGALTAIRITAMVLLCVIIWLPIGVWVGRRSWVAGAIQPVIQFLAAFPANLLFPFVGTLILQHQLNVDLWSSPLLVLGTQWYILFNVIAGVMALPKELRHASNVFQVQGWLRWKRLILPSIFPYLITGIITAVGGAWNASIIAEFLTWGPYKLQAHGLGAYITAHTIDGHFSEVALGIIVMCGYVLLINAWVWQPLYRLAAQRFKVE